MSRPLRIVVVYPDLLGTYGDGGNGVILARRAQWRDLDVELVQGPSDAALPDADLYCLGGGEDGPQVRAARSLITDGTLTRRVAAGAVVLAVCAGYQIVGTSFPGADGSPHEGVGLLDVVTTKGLGVRSVGEVVAETAVGSTVTLPTLTGFENHGGQTALAGDLDGETDRPAPNGDVPSVTVALAQVTHGVGNGDGSGTEGAVKGRVIGTYLHGPLLARNPALADLVLSWALGADAATLTPLNDEAAEALRQERLAATTGRRRGRRRRRP